MVRKFLLPLVLTLIMVIVMRWLGSSLITPQSPNGIIDLEFARTPERFRQLQFFWNNDDVLQNIYFSFLFIIAYTWFLAAATKAVNNKWSSIFSATAMSAGAFNVLENFLMIMLINGRFNLFVLEIIYYSAAIKFLLAGLVLLYLIVSLFGLFKAKPSS